MTASLSQDNTEKFSNKIIGGVPVTNPIFIAPMAGVTFLSFRLFHKELGASLVHTEMVSALGLIYGGAKTREYLVGSPLEEPCVLQLFGDTPDNISHGAEIALSVRSFPALQVNMACPMPKVTKKGAGSALLSDIKKSGQIITALKKFNLPVWAKIRLVGGDIPYNTEDFCQELLDNGCDFIAVHGRTRAQRYEGTSNKSAVISLAQKFKGLIGASGDIFTPEDSQFFLQNGAEAVFLARGLLRDAFLVPKTLSLLGYNVPQKYLTPSMQDQTDLLVTLGRKVLACEGEKRAVVLAKRQAAALFKGTAGAALLRQQISFCRHWQEIEGILQQFYC